MAPIEINVTSQSQASRFIKYLVESNLVFVDLEGVLHVKPTLMERKKKEVKGRQGKEVISREQSRRINPTLNKIFGKREEKSTEEILKQIEKL